MTRRPLSPRDHTRPPRVRAGLDRRAGVVEIRSRNCNGNSGRRSSIAAGSAVLGSHSWVDLAIYRNGSRIIRASVQSCAEILFNFVQSFCLILFRASVRFREADFGLVVDAVLM